MRRALVVGRSRDAMDEYRAARALCDFDYVIVVGKMGEAFPDQIDYWCSFHANLFDRWSERRKANGHPPARHYWGALYKGKPVGWKETRCAPISFVPSLGGSSGFLATWGALEVLRSDRVVLAGVPMQAEASHYAGAATEREVGATWEEADRYWATWEEYAGALHGRVTSMSGRTRSMLGEPTRQWMGVAACPT